MIDEAHRECFVMHAAASLRHRVGTLRRWLIRPTTMEYPGLSASSLESYTPVSHPGGFDTLPTMLAI